MKKTKIVAVLILLALAAGSVSALDLTSFPEPIEKGSLLISPSFGFGYFVVPSVSLGFGNKTKESTEPMLGGTVAFDFALPLNFAALTAGLESGFFSAKADDGNSSVNVIPIIARVAWHPNFEVSGLDVYLLAKIGYAIGFWGGDAADNDDISNPAGLIYGGNIGVRYFFTDRIGVFAEGGYEYSILAYEYEFDWNGMFGWGKKSYETLAGGIKYVSAGVTFKLF